ncbi:CD209 antigen-like protein E [Gouania willdenowi]|uniref:CD209 antigen-like protein E n=1 Tax=Gouania willdenowi TaxID=441366 RepID=A0A8C5E5N9_GOUWI|nr:CD209 antigen-like protein E [Gouania willdenowi]
MESKGELCFGPEGDYNTPICEDDLNDEIHVPYHQFSQDRLQKESMFSLNPGKKFRVAVGILALLAAVLLIVTISLGVHYYKITHKTGRISEEMTKLNETYKTKLKSITDAKIKLAIELSHMEQTKWEFEHLSKTSQDLKKQFDEVAGETTKLRSQLIMMDDSCKHCPPGWIMMNAVCFYFPSQIVGDRNWAQAREFCQLQGGDLTILDSKDKQNATVTYLRRTQNLSKTLKGFWIGLTDSAKEGTWKWVNGNFLGDGYWNDGEPNNANNEDCVSVYARQNFFKAWNDERCTSSLKWICEKDPAL